ncbi:speckle-type POZ protein B-like [Stegodyphus dumicola]|uniref:speckle-type POZ protein B-like n=1 Tax=Stegodyphus dumicola TaxID=202533 RepID=UPI0015AF5B7A|nr:speckle-type POZ protein B-like [Stegodyphus dumicola]
MASYVLDFERTFMLPNSSVCPSFGPTNDCFKEWDVFLIKGVEKEKYEFHLRRKTTEEKLQLTGVIELRPPTNVVVNVSDVMHVGQTTLYIFLSNLSIPLRTFFKIVVLRLTKGMKISSQSNAEIQNLNSSQKPMSTLSADTLLTLSRDIEDVYKKKDYSDMVLVVDTLEIHVHKFMLSARSPVFAGMLQHTMTESTESRVVISDVEQNVMKELVLFMYTGRVNDYSYPMARELYSAADKYAILELKGICRQVITSSLSTSTATEALILADMHSDEELKQNVMVFICSNIKKMKATPVWTAFLKEYSNLGTEVLSFVLDKLC